MEKDKDNRLERSSVYTFIMGEEFQQFKKIIAGWKNYCL